MNPISRRTLVAALAIAITGLSLPTPQIRLTGAQSTDSARYPGLGDPPLLVDPAWLEAERTRSDNLVILDLSPPRVYADGHIPGAVHAWWQDTMEVDDPVYGTVLQPDNFTDQTQRRELLQRWGIDDETTVVVYDDERGRWSARLVWFLRFLGHDRVSKLDGGLADWQASGLPVKEDAHDPAQRSTPTITPREGYYIGDDMISSVLADPRTLLIDIRTDDETHDDLNDALLLGRIPGAISVPWTSMLDGATDRLKSLDELASLLVGAGILPHRRIVLYGRFGVEAAHTWLTLNLMAFPEVVIYDRGWAGWASNPDNPIVPL